jgi:DNA polymerase III delta prime subunit
MALKEQWALKYRPKTLDNYIFQSETDKNIIEGYIKQQSIPNLMLVGHRGTGKTTLAYILKTALEIDDFDFLEINASDDNSVEMVRQKLTSFVNTIPAGTFKVVFLDEADYLTLNAQAVLRNMLEDEVISQNARFIFTCNYPQKILPEIRSRLQEFDFKTLSKDSMMLQAAEILAAEKVKVSSEELLNEFVDNAYPDMRKLIVNLQKNTIDGKLQKPTADGGAIEYKLEILDLLDKGDWERIRDIVCANVDGDEWLEVYRFIYDYIHEVGKFKDIKKWKQAIVIISDHLYRHQSVADAEINFTACIIRLTEV